MKLHLIKEEKYLLLFLCFCIFAYILVQYLGSESFQYELQGKKEQEKVIFPLDLNTASYGELLKVPGIGPVTAERIINYRYEKGNFKNINELMNIKGIGKKTLKKLKQYFKISQDRS